MILEFVGDVFVNGSAIHTSLAGLNRAGFSIVQIDRAGVVTAAVCGIVPLAAGPVPKPALNQPVAANPQA